MYSTKVSRDNQILARDLVQTCLPPLWAALKIIESYGARTRIISVLNHKFSEELYSNKEDTNIFHLKVYVKKRVQSI